MVFQFLGAALGLVGQIKAGRDAKKAEQPKEEAANAKSAGPQGNQDVAGLREELSKLKEWIAKLFTRKDTSLTSRYGPPGGGTLAMG